MNKLIILLACVLGTVSAGRILQRERQRDIGIADQRIERMSWQDLQRQKFLLDIVQHVQQPLQQAELLQLDQGLIIDPQRYRGGIDVEMQRIIDLDRQRLLLDERQTCSIQNVQHVQQLRGIYRLLVRALDFDTLQRNVIYLRRNINPVLLINALTLAIRDREDTQNLIMPAMQELLPELYLDQQTIERVQRMQLELDHSSRPSLVDLVGLGQRMRQVTPILGMVMPWRDLRLQMALKRQQQQVQQFQNRVVLPVQSEQQDISLLTEDIGMRNFVRNLIQQIALQEDYTNSRRIDIEGIRRVDVNEDVDFDLEQRRQLYGNIDNVEQRRQVYGGIDSLEQRRQVYGDFDNVEQRRQAYGDFDNVEQRRQLYGNIDNVEQRRQAYGDIDNLEQRRQLYGDIDSERLLRVGRRRSQQQQNVDDDSIYGNQRERFLGALRRDEDVQSRTVLQRGFGQGIGQFSSSRFNTDEYVNRLPTVDASNERLLHVGRRRQNVQPAEEQQQRRFLGVVRGERLSEGRRVVEQQQIKLQRNEQPANDELPTMRRDDERLVHINRRRLNQDNLDNIVPRRVSHIGEGRRVDDVDIVTEEDIMKFIRSDNRLGQFSDKEIVELLRRQRQQRQEQQQGQKISNVFQDIKQSYDSIDKLPTMRRDDERLVHINRRRLNQDNLDNIMPRRVSAIGEGRRVDEVDTMTDENIVKFIRSDKRLDQLNDVEILEMLHRQRQQRQEQQQNQSEQRQGVRYRRSLVDPTEQEQSTTRCSEILLQTLRQLLARLNQERISARLGNEELESIKDNSRLYLPIENQAQRYALRLNEMRLDSRRNRALLEQLSLIEQRFQLAINQLINRSSGLGQIEQQLRLTRVIGDVLVGRLGDVGILSILRELLQQSNVASTDRLGLDVSLRNPILQYTLRRILNFVDQQLEQQIGVYGQDQLAMQDVTINDVRVSELRTRLEDSDLDVSNLLLQQDQSQFKSMQMLVRQRRLSNKPFTIDLDISAQRAQDVIIRIFLGPRQDAAGRELSLEQRRQDFVLLDAIRSQLQSGRNRIQQRSTNIEWTTQDATSYSDIYRRVMTTLRGQQEGQQLLTELIGENGRFPQRLLLPRGRPEGLPMQLLVIVTPMERQERAQQVRLDRIGGVMGVSVASIEDNRPLGYPLDRRIDNEQQLLQLSNVQIQDVVIIDEN